ncbi:GNAT family N-acetyltransferase [Actinospica durhamensis]|uniref:GNAT family N-acetyltransferase n=1 Tax=Actinospica durhamensis TaxID=1508375 RepID=A0A941ISE5_9ACTN|nr:GNAT family N-acetyltransferase [Actinospica durhamensis]MBR7834808.1 GNAT family N-acetyltransferase [Actinospica durhamensis]
MEKLDIAIRPAVREDVPQAARMLARAFADDPAFAYQLPHEPSREWRLVRYFATLLKREALPLAATEVAVVEGGIRAATIWKPPGAWQPPLPVQIAALPGYITCFQARSVRALQTESVMFKEHPEDPHWYLHVIGTDPAWQGRGIGAALLRSRLERCDLEGLPAYLESSKLSNVPLYEHFGFEVTGVLGMPAAAPPITKMWRPGRPAVGVDPDA